ncbi:glycosyl transferase [Candidatus Francisella endociliophora]|uniref:Glycosyl transferase n=1 Tax=Candidatus Francisella endociliophora TaxID=653937 RepID=A0A097EN87_9GAMM|nr:glycosyltransferase family 8 protein [Francisella sp. FSC1006]AIT09028.1 glycosyl transferase [Francisella sp. FSC1006]
MKKIPIVFTFDKRIILGAATAIKSLIDTAKATTSYDIYVYHPDISQKYIKLFEQMISKTNHSIKFEYIDKSKFKDAPINKGGSWTEIVYYRLLIPELLPQYDKVIYSDVDVLFTEDMSDIYKTSLNGYELGAVAAEKNSLESVGHKYFEENKNEYIYWSGFLLMNTELMRELNFIDRCFATVKNFNQRLKFFDLDTINITSNKIKSLPFKYCTLQSIFYLKELNQATEYIYLKDVYSDEELIDAKNNPAIIHYAGKPGKPWRMKKPYPNYKEYIEKVPKELKKYTFRDIRKRIFSKT